MWEWSGNAKSDDLSNSQRSGNDLDVEEEERRVIVDDAKKKDVK